MVKILLQKNNKMPIDIQRCISVLEMLCTTLEFESLPTRDIDDFRTLNIEYYNDRFQVSTGSDSKPYDLYFYLTHRTFTDFYIIHEISRNIIVLSFSAWEHFSGLPIENGIIYFICRSIAKRKLKCLNHDLVTGCLYDFNMDLTTVDFSINRGLVCSTCLKEILAEISNSKLKENIYYDIISIIRAVAYSSQWGRSVFTLLKDLKIRNLSWGNFNDLVADYFKSTGAKVEKEKNIIGFQLDMFLTETRESGEIVKSIVECKFHKEEIESRIVNDFSRLASIIITAGHADKAILVSYSGFTKEAHLAAERANILLIQYSDIMNGKLEKAKPRQNKEKILSYFTEPGPDQKANGKVFVIMPFSEDLDDLYYFGIYETVNECEGICIRMDEEQFTGGILSQIYKNINESHIIIAEVTRHNPNVYYEIGYAHALNRQVILLTNDIKTAPFDLTGFNHIVYTSIKDLKNKLLKRLKALL